MSALTDIYEYFTPIEEAVAKVFAQNSVMCYTPLGEQLLTESGSEASDEQALQKKRPRVEVCLQPGAAKGILRPLPNRRVTSGHLQEKARVSQLTMLLVTEPNIVQHRNFIALVIAISDTLATGVNNQDSFNNFFIQSVRATGGTTNYKPEDGTFSTELTFDVEFSVQEYLWSALDEAEGL